MRFDKTLDIYGEKMEGTTRWKKKNSAKIVSADFHIQWLNYFNWDWVKI